MVVRRPGQNVTANRKRRTPFSALCPWSAVPAWLLCGSGISTAKMGSQKEFGILRQRSILNLSIWFCCLWCQCCFTLGSCSCTRTFNRSVTHSFIFCFIHSFICSITPWFIHSITRSFIHLCIHPHCPAASPVKGPDRLRHHLPPLSRGPIVYVTICQPTMLMPREC